MKYGYMTLPDETEVVHSEVIKISGVDTVDVFFEKPDERYTFCTAKCRLPQRQWSNIKGFSESDINFLKEFISNNSTIIFDLAKIGGFKNA